MAGASTFRTPNLAVTVTQATGLAFIILAASTASITFNLSSAGHVRKYNAHYFIRKGHSTGIASFFCHKVLIVVQRHFSHASEG
jgi:hypothetical protein